MPTRLRDIGDQAMTAEGRLELIGIDKRYGETTVLNGIDLTVEDGEFMTILGPSGSGKTTVLRLIGGFIAPDGGEFSGSTARHRRCPHSSPAVQHGLPGLRALSPYDRPAQCRLRPDGSWHACGRDQAQGRQKRSMSSHSGSRRSLSEPSSAAASASASPSRGPWSASPS